jgi:hypothetical protein
VLYPVLTLIAWRFKRNKCQYFSQDQKITASVISNSQCILPWSSKSKKNPRKQDWEKRAYPNLITQYNILKVMIFFATKKRSTFLNHWDKEYCPDVMNIYFIRDRQEQKILSRIPWHALVLHKILNIDCLCSTCQVCQMTKKERKKYGLLPRKMIESDILPLVHGLCGFGGCICNKDTSQNTLSACTHNDRSRNTTKVGLKLSKSQISQQHPSRICFITPGWHVTRDLNLLSLKMGVN